MARLRLFGRNWCHLCEDMRAALEGLRAEPGLAEFRVDVIDVDADPALVEKYDTLVPVLADADGRELCHYFLDAAKVREYLASFG